MRVDVTDAAPGEITAKVGDLVARLLKADGVADQVAAAAGEAVEVVVHPERMSKARAPSPDTTQRHWPHPVMREMHAEAMRVAAMRRERVKARVAEFLGSVDA